MMKVLASRKVIIAIWVFALLALLFSYVVNFTSVGLDREAYNRGEQVETAVFMYFGKKTYGGGAFPLPEALTFRSEDGGTLTPDEVVKVINPALNPFVKDGKVYTRADEWSEWGKKVYWELTPTNPVNAKLVKIVTAIRSISLGP